MLELCTYGDKRTSSKFANCVERVGIKPEVLWVQQAQGNLERSQNLCPHCLSQIHHHYMKYLHSVKKANINKIQ